MRSVLLVMAGFCLVATATSSQATMLQTERFTCPIGKQRFNATGYSSLTTYTSAPDGRPIGTMNGYVPYPECPRNRLIIYRDFSPAEIDALRALIKSPEYLRLVKAETSFYRVAWLENALHPQSPEYVWHLLRATWYVEGNAERKGRYRQAFLVVAENIPAIPSDIRSMILRLRVINAWREMGQFDRVLEGLSLLPIDVMTQGLPNSDEDAYSLSESDQARWAFVRDARRMKVLALRRDTSASPIDFLPQWLADEFCLFREPKTTFEISFCGQPDVMERTAEDRAYYEANPVIFAQERNAFVYDGPIQAPPPPPKPMKMSPK